MNVAYLIRAGLGIPDYWHPQVEIHHDFLSGEIRRYPFSVEGKADYHGQLNEENVPIIYFDDMKFANPVTVILYGLGSHDAFIITGNKIYHEQMMHVLSWLEQHAVPLGKGIGWSNENDIPVYGMKAPWFSALTQGLAISLLVRAHILDGTGPWSSLTYQTWLGYSVTIEEGGFCRKNQYGVFYEEYPSPQLNCVFNGMCHALIGLWEAWKSGVVSEAELDFKLGVSGLRHHLPQFDQGGWSAYSLHSCLGKPILASPYYQSVNALMSRIIGLMAEESEFLYYGDRWSKNNISIIRRIEMSLRIGFERYFRQPSLLNSDCSKKR